MAITIDDALSSTSTNPVQNRVIKSALDGKADTSALPHGVPSGGTTGQVLVKTSNSDYAATWQTITQPSGTKQISINANGTTTEDVTNYATAQVVANVPNTYSASDEGKVVDNGALVSQTSDTVTANDTYDTTLINSLTVNVSGGASDNYDMDIAPYDVIYIDYDGNPVYWYAKADFLALSAHPANPSHTGLTAQGWNWTLADAKTYVTNYGKLIIGQTYKTADGKTHIFIDIPEGMGGITYQIYFKSTVADGVTFDWGDGTTNTSGAASNTSKSHIFANSGEYEITLTAAQGATYYLGYAGSNNTIIGTNNGEGRAARSYVKKVYIGDSVTKLERQCFKECRYMESLSVPTGVSIDPGSSGSFLSDCSSIKGFVIPSGIEFIPYIFVGACFSLKFLSVPKSVTELKSNAFSTQANNMTSLRALTLPGLTSLAGQILNVTAAEWLIVPGTYDTLPGSVLASSWKVSEFTVPASVTTISANALVGRITRYHLLPTTPPTLANTNGIAYWSETKIYVPYSADHSILEAYKTATNWSSLASYMQEEPQ